MKNCFKRGISLFVSFILSAAMVSCGDSEEETNNSENSGKKNSSVSETISEEETPDLRTSLIGNWVLESGETATVSFVLNSDNTCTITGRYNNEDHMEKGTWSLNDETFTIYGPTDLGGRFWYSDCLYGQVSVENDKLIIKDAVVDTEVTHSELIYRKG